MNSTKVPIPDRLAALLTLLPPKGGVADIGTDHGYIPIRLALDGKHHPLIATDVSSGPLAAAKENMIKYGVEEKILLRLGSGLDPLVPGEVTTVVAAGMGQATLLAILEQGRAQALATSNLILQPMDGAAGLRQYMVERNWRIDEEIIAVERGKYYETLVVRPGIPFELPKGLPQSGLSEEELIAFGPLLLARRDPVLGRMMNRRFQHYLAVVKGIEKANSQDTKRLRELTLALRRMEKVIEWLR